MKVRKIIYVILVVGCLFGFVTWSNNTLNVGHIASKCESQVRETIDPNALQTWATNLLAAYTPGATNWGIPPYPGLAHIWKDPPSVYISVAVDREESFVCVRWGGGTVGHWGIAIGRASFVPEIPEHGSQLWIPGVYFWRNFH